MYRGMHHPSDVAASFLNGAVCIVVLARSVLDRTVSWGRRTRAAVAAAAH
jgi:undecaprenyl-diphosphatase